VNYIATFTPQAWLNDSAVTVDAEGDTSWDCTAELATMPADYRAQVIESGHDIDDWLKGDGAAPQWVREWQGPFEIHVREADVGDAVDAILDPIRKAEAAR
jgi:hypothetical protein